MSSISSKRQTLVTEACKQWIARLIDLSRRNNLLYYRPLISGTVELDDADAKERGLLLAGKKVNIRELLRNPEEFKEENLTRIRRAALLNMEERGLDTLHVAIGMASWSVEDGGRAPCAPVILLPVKISLKMEGSAGSVLELSGEPQINWSMVYVLTEKFGCKIDTSKIFPEDFSSAEDHELAQLIPDALKRLELAAAAVTGFTLDTERCVLGNFSFQKMAMVEDLLNNGDALAANPLVAALAGDMDARKELLKDQGNIQLADIDCIKPEDDFTVLDADSSQLLVVERALRGQSGVVQGPPGTGKSQTIANLIAALTARGKKVLFVAEKRAALEAVMKRLSIPSVGLDHLILDLHGAGVSRKAVMAKMAKALEWVRDAPLTEFGDSFQTFSRGRAALNEHVHRMHDVRAPFNTSVYSLRGRLLELSALPEVARVSTRWRGAELGKVVGAQEAIVEALNEIAALSELFLGHGAWGGACLPNGSAAQQAVDCCAKLAKINWDDLHDQTTKIASNHNFSAPETLDQALRMLENIQRLEWILCRYKPCLFSFPLHDTVQALGRAQQGILGVLGGMLFDSNFRAARARMKSASNEKSRPTTELLKDAQIACDLAQYFCGRVPLQVSPDAGLTQDMADAKSALTEMAKYITCFQTKNISFDSLKQAIYTLGHDRMTAFEVPRVRMLEAEATQNGVGSILNEWRKNHIVPDYWPSTFAWAYTQSCLEDVAAKDSRLMAFRGTQHQQMVDEFRRSDKNRLGINAARIRRQHAQQAIASMDQHREQEALVRREANKKTRHLPLRQLLAKAPDVMMALCPCWMVSPLSVSQLLDADRRYFDVVIFDEASQVLPEDAVSALLRAERVIVAGDRHQLPPTQFFADQSAADASADSSKEGATEGFESLLDTLSAFLPNWLLSWHYRSLDERLIAFSNHFIYDGRLVTFPGLGRDKPLRHVLVDQPLGEDGQEESVSTEIEQVVQAVLEHATSRPMESLGVITMGIKHADRVQMAIDRALAQRSDLADFFSEDKQERFFIKNLERVQGDERDVIILSIGYGKDRAGNLPHRFGPLNYEGGHRRLNVAITRARRSMIVVSSFSHLDVDPARAKARGAVLLRSFLEFASTGGSILSDEGTTSTPLNPFEADIRDALSAQGMKLLPQYGASHYRIDLVAQHPERAGEMVLAIECDGASYHSAPCARDRDRLRQQQLEALGWKFHRIWSTDWFRDRETEITRAMVAYQAAIRASDVANDRRGRPLSMVPVIDKASFQGIPPMASSLHMPASRRPSIPRGFPIDEYSDTQLKHLLTWVHSDGRNRTQEELMARMVEELGFSRRGAKIEARLKAVIEKWVELK